MLFIASVFMGYGMFSSNNLQTDLFVKDTGSSNITKLPALSITQTPHKDKN